MKYLSFLFLVFWVVGIDAQVFPYTDGLYRIPYATGTEVYVSSDVSNHSPRGKIDFNGDCGLCIIVAAAGGWIRWIEEDFDVECHPDHPDPDNQGPCCWQQNNFVILEHPNGEWTSYIHLTAGSVSLFGHEVGDWVPSGTSLGFEGSVGCSTGPHLHFEVSRPHDPNETQPFLAPGGMLHKHGQMLNPVICGIYPFNQLYSGSTHVASICNDNCPTNLTLTGPGILHPVARADNSINSTATFHNNTVGIYRTGHFIQLTPGFQAQQGARFGAKVATCNQQN